MNHSCPISHCALQYNLMLSYMRAVTGSSATWWSARREVLRRFKLSGEKRTRVFSATSGRILFKLNKEDFEEYCNIQTERRWALFFNSLHSHRRFRLWSLHKRHLLDVMNMNLGRIIVTPRNGNFDKIIVTSERFLLNSLASVGVCETSVVTEELPLTLGLLPILEEYWAWTRTRRFWNI